MLVSFSRAFKFAIKDFGRNIWLSFVTITVIGLALISFNFLVGLNFLSEQAIDLVQDKIDVSVYFKPEAPEAPIQDLKSNLEALTEVKQVSFVSREEALESFKLKHQDDQEILKSLEELNDNPLGASLIVKAKSPNDYPAILEIIERPRYGEIIADKNFDQHKEVISKIVAISNRVKAVGLVMSLAFSLIAIMVVFNTVRVSIYTHRDEIGIMKLVGATNGFIRLPYLIEGFIFSLLGLLIIILAWYPLLGFLQPHLDRFFGTQELALAGYFTKNFVWIFGVQLGAVVLLNIIGSWVAVNKYLKV